MNLRDTIKKITRKHLEKNKGLILGQCLSAVGWVNGTVPDTFGIVELPMTDVAGAGFAVGAAVAGRRPILVIRFQDFLTLNMSPIVNFAAKRKDIWGRSVPLFVRALAQEGFGTGPTHSAKYHSLMCHFPGLRVWCPITPKEWEACWHDFMMNDDPVICCEHKSTFDIDYEIHDQITSKSEVVVFAISTARLNALKAVEDLKKRGIKCSFVNISQLKPWKSKEFCMKVLRKNIAGLVVDSGFENISFSRDIAYQMMLETGVKVKVIGLEDKSVGCSKETENATPSCEMITEEILKLL